MQGCGLRDRARQFADKNAAILGVSFDTAAENKAFKDKFDFPFPLLCDESRQMGIAYGAAKDASAGHAARVGCVIGPTGTVHRFWPNVDAKGFPESVLHELPGQG